MNRDKYPVKIVPNKPTEFSFSLPLSEVTDSSKSSTLRPKLKLHTRQKPNSYMCFQGSFVRTKDNEQNNKIISNIYAEQKK